MVKFSNLYSSSAYYPTEEDTPLTVKKRWKGKTLKARKTSWRWERIKTSSLVIPILLGGERNDDDIID